MKEFKEQIANAREVAMYASMTMDDFVMVDWVRYVDYDEHFQALPPGQTREVPPTNYVRITQPVAVKFTPITNEEVVACAMASLNEQERKTIDELNQKLAAIREKKSQLLALTHQPEPCGHPVGRVGVNAAGNAECGVCGQEITEPSVEVE